MAMDLNVSYASCCQYRSEEFKVAVLLLLLRERRDIKAVAGFVGQERAAAIQFELLTSKLKHFTNVQGDDLMNVLIQTEFHIPSKLTQNLA